MKVGEPALLRGGAKALAPLIVLIALAALADGAPGAGLAGGALLSLATVLHALVFGAAASQRAAPAPFWRVLAALAMALVIGAAAAPDWRFAAAAAEAGVASAFVAAAALGYGALAARAPILRDEDW